MPLYMKITNPNIRGGSSIKTYSGAFELISISWGFSILAGFTGGNITKPHASAFTVTLNAYALPALLASVNAGTTHDITIYEDFTGNKGGSTATIELNGALIVAAQETANDASTIQLTIRYQRLTYSADKTTFSFDGPVG